MPERGSGPNLDPAAQLAQSRTAPDAKTVAKLHQNSDIDHTDKSQHHTLGPAQFQASSGRHSHNGSDSVQLLAGFSITGTRGSATAVVSIIAALVQLGATDNTTP